MLLRLSLFLEASCAVSLFLRMGMHLSPRTEVFGALSGKKQTCPEVAGDFYLVVIMFIIMIIVI